MPKLSSLIIIFSSIIVFLAALGLFFGRWPAETAVAPESGAQLPGQKDGNDLQLAPNNLALPTSGINVENLKNSKDPDLRKFAEYESLTDSAFSGLMIFVQMPDTSVGARQDAVSMAAKLKEFSAANVMPIVVMEPFLPDGQVANFSQFAKSGNDPLKTYFASLKEQGIGGKQMGIWIPFPEPNTDSWGKANSDPKDFVSAFNAYGAIFKTYFSDAKLCVLLDNQTFDYSADDYSEVSLIPYLEGVDRNSVSIFGLQGFPWAPPAGSADQPVADAKEFINSERAVEAAKLLGVQEILFNTGTYASMYSQDKAKTVIAGADLRKKILDSILEQSSAAKNQGFVVTVNIFSQDKSREPEAVDWSYWHNLDNSDAHTDVFRNFARQARNDGITLAVFDSFAE